MILDSCAQRIIGEDFEPSQNGMVDAPTEAQHSLIAHAERYQCGFIEVKTELRFWPAFLVPEQNIVTDINKLQRIINL